MNHLIEVYFIVCLILQGGLKNYMRKFVIFYEAL